MNGMCNDTLFLVPAPLGLGEWPKGQISLKVCVGVSPYRKLQRVLPTHGFHNVMHNDCLTYDYSICDIVSQFPVHMMVKNEMLCNQVSNNRPTFSLSQP